jgi:hypothetical protein
LISFSSLILWPAHCENPRDGLSWPFILANRRQERVAGLKSWLLPQYRTRISSPTCVRATQFAFVIDQVGTSKSVLFKYSPSSPIRLIVLVSADSKFPGPTDRTANQGNLYDYKEGNIMERLRFEAYLNRIYTGWFVFPDRVIVKKVGDVRRALTFRPRTSARDFRQKGSKR